MVRKTYEIVAELERKKRGFEEKYSYLKGRIIEIKKQKEDYIKFQEEQLKIYDSEANILQDDVDAYFTYIKDIEKEIKKLTKKPEKKPVVTLEEIKKKSQELLAIKVAAQVEAERTAEVLDKEVDAGIELEKIVKLFEQQNPGKNAIWNGRQTKQFLEWQLENNINGE